MTGNVGRVTANFGRAADICCGNFWSVTGKFWCVTRHLENGTGKFSSVTVFFV